MYKYNIVQYTILYAYHFISFVNIINIFIKKKKNRKNKIRHTKYTIYTFHVKIVTNKVKTKRMIMQLFYK